MADTATAMRDPIFYRWHKFIDDLFQRYKMSLLPYTMEDVSVKHHLCQGKVLAAHDQRLRVV